MNPKPTRFFTEPALLLPGAVQAMLQPIDVDAMRAAEHPVLTQLRQKFAPVPVVDKQGCAVLPVRGPLALRPDFAEVAWYGVEDIAAVSNAIDAMAKDPAVKCAVLDFDSPGGFLPGGPELAAKIADFPKPIVAYTESMACSLAYWLASQCDGIVVSRNGTLGSVGVYFALQDSTRLLENIGIHTETITNTAGTFKALGAGGGNLRQSERAYLQSLVDETFEMFKADVTAKRPGVQPDALNGKTFRGQAAIDIGLADFQGTLETAKLLAMATA